MYPYCQSESLLLQFALDTFFEMQNAIILETAVQDGKVMQDFESESPTTGGEHSQKVKAPPVVGDYGSKDCVNLPSSTAVSRIIHQDSLEKMEKLLLKMLHFCTFSPKLASAIPLLQKARIAILDLEMQKKRDFKKLSSFLAKTLKIFLRASKAHLKKETFLLFLVEHQLLSLFTLPFSSEEELKKYIASKYAKRGFPPLDLFRN